MSGEGPELSVIVATHNRSKLLRRCLEALSRQDERPDRFEVIVADDGSSDDTATMAESLETPFALRVLRLQKGGQAAAQNVAIEAARGQICLFVDDDVIASPGLVRGHLEGHAGSGQIIGVGKLTQQPPDARDWFAHAFANAWNEHYEELLTREPNWRDCYGGNLSVERRALIEVGGFTQGMQTADDTELAFRLVQSGRTPTYLPAAAAVHDDQKLRPKMLADRQRIGRGSIELIERHPGMIPRRLGGFAAAGPRELALRRLLIALRVPPGPLSRLGPLIPGEGRRSVWFYFVSRYALWLGVRSGADRGRWALISRGVPILMYHAFTDDRNGSRYVQPARGFARQLRLLRLLGYRAVPLADLAAALIDGKPLPRRAVAITIDDGYADNLTVARRLLAGSGVPATVFVVTGRLGGGNDWSSEDALAKRQLLSAEKLKEAAGPLLDFQPHTRTHASLPGLDEATMRTELRGSQEDVEALLGKPARHFAYPYGRFDDAVTEATADSFEIAFTVENRRALLGDDPMRVPRIEIRGTDSLWRFLRKLRRGGS